MKTVEHLINKLVPSHYDLFFDINRESKTFSGKTIIQANAKAETIKLHQKDLNITEVKINGRSVNFELDNENDHIVILAGQTGDITIEIDYTGNITDNMDGIYPCYYTHNGQKKELVATQFESHFARQAFPCVDEPIAKATFDLKLKFDQKDGEVALANMPEAKVGQGAETGLWKFMTTPRMSTYILAFAMGDLQSISTETNNGTKVSIYSTKAHELDHLNFALDIAKRAIEFFEDYYGFPYPLPQSLHVALPDFSAGAMENWGLVTYREMYLIADENTSLQHRQGIALTISHELAHMWFGNLVTMNWWDNLWLNESFANMMEYVCVNALEPSWNIFETFQSSDVPAALNRDATDGVQSVQTEVKHPDEVNTIFDAAIVYAKGSRLLQMLRYALGDEIFAKGLNKYFKEHQYQNTSGEDLWSALSSVSGKDISEFMNSWLTQPGYPVVNAKLNNNTIHLEQEQFFIGPHQDKNRLYQIPLNSTWEDINFTFTDKETELSSYSVLREKHDKPFRLNFNNMAHYITNYDEELLRDILNNFKSYDKINKYQLVQEQLLLAQGQRIPYANLIKFAQKLSDEQAFMLVGLINRILRGLELFVDEQDDSKANLKALSLLSNINNFNRLGFLPKTEDSSDDEIVREATISNILFAEYQPAIAEAHKLFNDNQNNLEQLPATIRFFVLRTEVQHFESEALVNDLLNLYENSSNVAFKDDIKSALAFTKNQNNLNNIISTWKNKDIVKPQDLASWYSAFLHKDFCQETAWNWGRDNWEWLKVALGGDMSFDSFVRIPGYVFKTEERLQEFNDFFKSELDNFAIKRNIEMSAKQIEARIDLIKANKEEVKSVLKDFAKE